MSARISGERKGTGYHDGLPAEVESINQLVEAYVAYLQLAVPPTPDEVQLSIDVNNRITMELPQALWNPRFYIGKTIEEIAEHPDGGATIHWQEESALSLRGQLISASRPLERYAGKQILFVTTQHTKRTSQGDLEPSQEVTLDQLLADPDLYEGKRVAVSGYYKGEFEDSSLSVTKEASQAREYARSVWIGGGSTFADAEHVQFPTGYGLPATRVRVEGVFFKGPGGHLSLWPGEIQRLTMFQAEPGE